MIVYNGAFGGKKLGAQTFYTPFPAAAGQAQGLYQPYPPGWAPKQAPRIVLPPSPASALIVSEAPVPSSMVPAEVQAAVKAPSTSPVAGFAIAAALLGGGALIASLIA